MINVSILHSTGGYVELTLWMKVEKIWEDYHEPVLGSFINPDLYSIFFLFFSTIFPAILHLSLSLLPNMVRLLPYLVPERGRSGEQRAS